MKKEIIPLVWRQLIFIGLIFLIPILFSFGVIVSLPSKQIGAGTNLLAALCFLSISIAIVLGICIFIFMRRQIILSNEKLTIKHSFYEININKSDVTSIQIEKLSSIKDLAISTKKNGIAAFGLYSGWFFGPFGDLLFCAISKFPIYRVNFEGKLKCSVAVLSCTDDMAESIRLWIR